MKSSPSGSLNAAGSAFSTHPPADIVQNCSNADNASNGLLYMTNFENIIAPGKEPNMTKEYKPRLAYELEKRLSPQLLKRHVFQSEKMQKIIHYYAEKNNCSIKLIEKEVKNILDEIGLERNLAIIRWCGMAITAIGKRICTGIYVNRTNIETVKQGLGRNPVLYLPSHRSYMDFILMSYICFYYDIEIPGIAAGMDFHSMFGMGTMLRKTGAFFMRRSFSNDELYWDIFREYMYALVSAYHIGVEFFIEGTRSRNFKALVPKIGLLSMALLPYFTGDVPDITVVPISVSYERVLEEQLFVYELLGVPKPRESTKGFFKALKIIDEHFGKMYLDFGAPISVREFFGHTSEDRVPRASVGAHLQKLNKKEVELVKKLANEIVYQQQRRIVISTFNLLSLYFASQIYAKRLVNIDELIHGVRILKQIFEELGAHVATNSECINSEIYETVEIHANIVHFYKGELRFTKVAPEQLKQEIETKRLKAHRLTPQTMGVSLPSLSLQLYINPCLFWLINPAYLLLSAMRLKQERADNPSQYRDNHSKNLLQELEDRVKILSNIFKHEFINESNREADEFNRNLNFLKKHDILNINVSSDTFVIEENDCSRVILSALVPYLCLYYQLAVSINQFVNGDEFTTTTVLVRVQERIERLLQQRAAKHIHPYCLALDNLNIALNSFVQEGYLIRNKDTGSLRHSSTKTLRSLEMQLLEYCTLLPFTEYHETAEYVELLSDQWQASKL